jgi:hypothetical protein
MTDRLEALRRNASPTNNNLLWNGDDLTGRSVSVRCPHGLANSIKFKRFFRSQIHAELSVFVQPALLPLFRQQQGFG